RAPTAGGAAVDRRVDQREHPHPWPRGGAMDVDDRPLTGAGQQAPAWLHPWLAWLDVALHREVLRLRARYELSLDELRGLYVSDEQVDRLLVRSAPDGPL